MELGHVLYSEVARSPLFLEGIERLEKGAEKFRVAMMCAEENPAECHRHLLVARILTERGVIVEHIRGDGRVQSEAEVAAERADDDAGQLKLFAEPEEESWKSTRSVLPKNRPPSSSGN